MAKKEVKEKKQKGHYFKDMKAELKKVIWPTPKQLLNNTMAVIAFTLIIAVIVFVLDLCFDAINTYGITALQEKIQTSYQESHPSEENTESDNTTTTDESSETTENETSNDTTSEDSGTEIEVETDSNTDAGTNTETNNSTESESTNTDNTESQE